MEDHLRHNPIMSSMAALLGSARSPGRTGAARSSTSIVPLYRSALGLDTGLQVFLDTAHAPVLGGSDVTVHTSTKYAYPSSYSAGVGVASTPAIRCYAIGNNVRVLSQVSAGTRIDQHPTRESAC